HTQMLVKAVIHGFGGIKKTQIAIETAYRMRDAHPDCSIFWVPVVDITMFENVYRGIGRVLEIRGIEDDDAGVKALIKAALSFDNAGPWLFIIDNADDRQLLTDGQLMVHLPFNRKSSILFTTRNNQDAESVKLLHQNLQPSQIGESKWINKLLKHLVHLPLAIRQVSAFMARNRFVMVAKTYYRYGNTANAVATIWLIFFEQIVRDAPLAASYLQTIAYYAEEDIPVLMLHNAEKLDLRKDDLRKYKALSILKGTRLY
ncbi:uncharacterized protein PpBr36_10658, partial [Pyricularia pennisetigena]|uniref:uncharacterized protein n=1 Tax=Pyricularia pennisetigena TaxID=1578925 RepID=UPI00115248E9